MFLLDTKKIWWRVHEEYILGNWKTHALRFMIICSSLWFHCSGQYGNNVKFSPSFRWYSWRSGMVKLFEKRIIYSATKSYFCRPRYQPNQFLTVCGKTPIYQNWATGEPNDENQQEGCGQLYTGTFRHGKWNDKECFHSIQYICEFNYLRCELLNVRTS